MFNLHQDNRPLTLYDTTSNGYKSIKEQKKLYRQKGFYLDKKLSNGNEQVLYNPIEKKVVVNVAGSHSLYDWMYTDPMLAIGKLKNTSRYQEADKALKMAKQKYNPSQTVVTGQSLGGSIAGYIAGNNDKVYTLNKGVTFGMKPKANEQAFRIDGDIVSGLGVGYNNMKTLKNNSFVDPITSHSPDRIKKEDIFV